MKTTALILRVVISLTCSAAMSMKITVVAPDHAYVPLKKDAQEVMIASKVIKQARARHQKEQEARKSLITDIVTTSDTLTALIEIEHAKTAAQLAALELRREMWRQQDEEYEKSKK